jgi:hypothetical protein
MIPPLLNLRSKYQHVTPPSTSVAPTTKQRVKSYIPVLHQWLPPHCQTSCFFSVGTFLVFPGSSTAIPTPLLEKQMPYVYKCSCDTNKPPTLSHSSTTVDHSLPSRFNGTLFGQAFYLPPVAQALLAPHKMLLQPSHCLSHVLLSRPPLQLLVFMIVPFAKPDSIALTIQPQNNLLHTPPILSEIPHVCAIPDPTNTQRQVATSTLAQYTILSPYSS